MIEADHELTAEVALELLKYDAASDTLRWCWRSRGWFRSDRSWRVWNRKHSGKVALDCQNTHGDRHGTVLGRQYTRSRIVHLLVNGTWPAARYGRPRRRSYRAVPAFADQVGAAL